MPNNRTQVLIIGGGPVGMMMALHLDYYGVACTIFNEEEQTRMEPKGNTQNSRTMEHYRRLGIAEAIRSIEMPFDHPFDVAFFTRLNGYEIVRYPRRSAKAWMERRKGASRVDQFVEPIHTVNQMYAEAFLLKHMKSRALVTERFGWKVEHFSQSGADVSLTATGPDGATEQWQADYLIGCDGGRGAVRRSLGISFEGDVMSEDAYFAGDMLRAHLRIPDLYPKHLSNRRAWAYWSVNKDVRAMLVALNGRDEFLLHVRSSFLEGDRRKLIALLHQMIGEPLPVEIVSLTPWNAGAALVAERFGEGRIFLAGDSAHLFTPTGGFGFNTGIDDTSNLAWKLAAVLQGWGGPDLLASYERERKPVGYRNTRAARGISSALTDIPIPDALELDGPAGDAARSGIVSSGLVEGSHFSRSEEDDAMGVQLGARYDGSPLIVSDAPPPPDSLTAYVPSGIPGGRAPHFWVNDGREIGDSLFDQFGECFTLLRFGSHTSNTQPLMDAAAELNVPLNIIEVESREARALYERDLVLIRPDGYIAWRGDDLPAQPRRLIAQVTGFAPADKPQRIVSAMAC